MLVYWCKVRGEFILEQPRSFAKMMRIMKLLVVSGLFMQIFFTSSAPALANADKNLFKDFPQTKVVTLSSGEKISLPFHVYDGQILQLGGFASLEKLDSVLRPYSLKALPVTSTLGMVSIFGVSYSNTSIGPYQEAEIMIAATSDDFQSPRISDFAQGYLGLFGVYLPSLGKVLKGKIPEIGFFTWKIFVTSELARAAGKEIWNYPKKVAEVQFVSSPLDHSFAVKAGSLCSIEAKAKGRFHSLGKGIPMDMRFNIVNEGRDGVSALWSKSLIQGRAGMKNFGKKDSFFADKTTECGESLDSIGFKPLFWQATSRVQAAFPE